MGAGIRQWANDHEKMIESAASDYKNLLSPYASELRVALCSLGSTLTIDAQRDFKDAFSSSLEGYSTTVLSDGSIDARIQALNDALFAAGRAQGNLKAESYALHLQQSVVTAGKSLPDGTGGGARSFLAPVQYTAPGTNSITNQT